MMTNEQMIKLKKGDTVYYAELPDSDGEVKVTELKVKGLTARTLTIGEYDNGWQNRKIDPRYSSKWCYGVTIEEAVKGARDLAEQRVDNAKFDLEKAELELRAAERAVRKLEPIEGFIPDRSPAGQARLKAQKLPDQKELAPNAIFAKVYGE